MFGRLLKEFRYLNGLSYREFGKELGICYLTIYKWEKGISKPLPAMCKKLSDYMKSKGFEGNLVEYIFND